MVFWDSSSDEASDDELLAPPGPPGPPGPPAPPAPPALQVEQALPAPLDAPQFGAFSDPNSLNDDDTVYVEDDPAYIEPPQARFYATYAMPNIDERHGPTNLAARVAFYAAAGFLPMCQGCGAPTGECCVTCNVTELHPARPLCHWCEAEGLCPLGYHHQYWDNWYRNAAVASSSAD